MSLFSANRFIPNIGRFAHITSSYRALRNMFSTETTTEGDAADPHAYLLNTSHDLLEDHLAAKESELDFTLKASHSVPFSAFDHGGLYDRYDESGPSSVQPGDNNDFSEPGGSHMSLKDDVDESLPILDASPGQADVAMTDATELRGSEQHLVSAKTEDNDEPPMATDEFEKSNEPSFHHDSSHLTAVGGHVEEGFKVHQPPQPPHRGRGRPRKISINGDVRKSSESSTKPDSPGITARPLNYSPPGKSQPAFKAKSSIPALIPVLEFARQCILAAQSSRLNPFALHPGEYELLRDHITHSQVTVYLNIRNAILRLWTRTPLVAVTKAEAAGCAKDARYFNMAQIAYKWLVRNGYINFGCVELQSTAGPIPRAKAKGRRRTIVVVGAGMSGLGCARQLEGLIAQLGEQWSNNGERPPRVIVLEGRRRIGGRVYSHPLKNQAEATLPSGLRSTAEMGAQVVTGYEHGNPLNAIIRGQLALHYHALKDDTILYDHDGTAIEREGQDMLVEKLYNDILERASHYRNKPTKSKTVEGDRRLIQLGRDPTHESGDLISSLEDVGASKPVASVNKHSSRSAHNPNALMGMEKLAGRAYTLADGTGANVSAASAANNMGWELKSSVPPSCNLNLDAATEVPSHPTLGATMDEAIRQYQDMMHMTPKDMRLFNWHHANMEYSNAANVNQLSLGGWDQDIGNEFEGQHSQIIGGYQQLPRGLWQCPTKLDVRFNSPVKAVRAVNDYQIVECENGDVIEADEVVMTAPLGVLKKNQIAFDPPLPEWKTGPIERLGFGLLNKVILVYDSPFWESDRDMFGTLNEAEIHDSMEQKDYELRRGRFWLFWNCLKTSGRPTLVALMAGNAAHDTEVADNNDLIHEVTERLKKMFAPATVPLPSEVIITRWKKDPFACGSYSYMGPQAQAGDYNAMAKPIGTLHFAGEATCGTHPATVHGAYLSGLRAASEVVESMLGAIEVPHPLVAPKTKPEAATAAATATPTGTKRPRSEPGSPNSRNVRQMRNEDIEASIISAILEQIGQRPLKPERTGNNPYLLYTRDHWHAIKAECDAQRRAATGDAAAKASKDSIRAVIGAKWRGAGEEVQRPYVEEAGRAKEASKEASRTWKAGVEAWDREAARIRREVLRSSCLGEEDVAFGKTAIESGGSRRERRGV